MEAITAEHPDFLIFVGDMVSKGLIYSDWDEFLFMPFRNIISNTPFFHCAGNHEEHSGYMREFLATPSEGYYSFNYDNAHFTALDSTVMADHIQQDDGSLRIMPVKDFGPGKAQYNFLVKDLENNKSKWKIVFFHYPPFVSATYQAKCLRILSPVFEKYNVDLVFNSHAIVYERSHPITGDMIDYRSGVRYIVAGGAGAAPDWFFHKKNWHSAKTRAVPHFVHVVITSRLLELQAIDYKGHLFDTLIIDKNGNYV